jgi:hypothetical protein
MGAAVIDVSYRELYDLCDGKLGIADVACPWCGHDCKHAFNRRRKVLRIWHDEQGFATFNCARCNKNGWAREDNGKSWKRDESPEQIVRRLVLKAKEDEERRRKLETAKELWETAVPLFGTLGYRYLTEHRGLDIGMLGEHALDHCLRFNERSRAIVAAMTNPASGKATGVHRIFLEPDGSKRERLMLGRAGVVRLSLDDSVTQGLGIAEGIEKSLAILISGWAPIWCACSAGGIKNFPVLNGVEALTIFSDDDDYGANAARECADRWVRAGNEAFIVRKRL